MPVFNNYFRRDFAPYNAQGALVRFTTKEAMPKGNQQQMEQAEMMYLCSAMFWAAVQQILKPCRAARLKVEKKSGDDWVEDDKNEIAKWWKFGVNPEMNGRVWVEAYVTHLAVYGIFRNEWTPKGMASPDDRNPDGTARLSGNPDEAPWLTPIVPYVLVPDIRKDLTEAERKGLYFKMPMVTNKYGRLNRYMHATTEDLQFGYPVAVSDVFIAKNYNPVRGYIGISPLLMLSEMLGMGDSLVRHSYSYLKNNGIPSGIVTYSADSSKYQTPTLSPDERKAVEQAYMNMFAQEGERPNSPAFFPAGIDFKPLAAPIKDLMPAELWDIVQAVVHEILGTSPTESLVGLRHGNTRASAKSHQTSVWLYTCEPMLEYISESLGNFLFPRFGQRNQWEDGKVRLGWDFSKVPAFREIQELYNKTVLEAARDSIAQINEARKALGLPEDPELQGCYLQKQSPITEVPNAGDPANPETDPTQTDPQKRKNLPGKQPVVAGVNGVKK